MLHEDGASEADVVAYLASYGLETPERARHRLSFISDPLWRAYVFTYHVGYDLLGAWLEASDDPDGEPAPGGAGSLTRRQGRQSRFARLLADQVTPSAIRSQLGT